MRLNYCSARIADVIIVVPIHICLLNKSSNVWIELTFFDIALIVNICKKPVCKLKTFAVDCYKQTRNI